LIHTRPVGQTYDVQAAVDEEAALLSAYRLSRMYRKPLPVEP
jgi:hypothetical protein